MNFTIKKQPKEEKVIEWELLIDDEGDLNLIANGLVVLFVDKERCRLWRMTDRQCLGLQTDTEGRIKIADE